MSDPHRTPDSSFWVPCSSQNIDLGTPLWAWWGKSITVDMETITVPPEPIAAIDEESEPAMDVDRATTFNFPTIDLGQFLRKKAPGRILVREEYEAAILVMEERQGRNRVPPSGSVVTGQPGIGKTCFLWYLLRHRLYKKLPTIFSLGSHLPLLFCEAGAFQQKDPLSESPMVVMTACDVCGPGERLWVLVDVGKKKQEPPDSLIDGEVFVVQTTSPDEVRFKQWIKQTDPTRRPASIMLMNPWEWKELVAGLKLNRKKSATQEQLVMLREFARRFGPVPRTVYSAFEADPSELATLDTELTLALNRLTLPALEALTEDALTNQRVSDFSHSVVCVSRPPTSGIAWFHIRVTPLSPYVLMRLIKSTHFRTMEEKRTAFWALSGKFGLGTYRGWPLEFYAHGVLTSRSAHGDQPQLELFPLAGVDTMTYSSASPAQEGFPFRERAIHCFRASDANWSAGSVVNNTYYYPEASNNPGFDSFVVIGETAYVFQITANKRHPVDSAHRKGLKLLQKLVPLATKWRYILVVPHDVKDYALTHVNGMWLDPSPQKEFYVATLALKTE